MVEIIHISEKTPKDSVLKKVAHAIKRDELVIFPTETVYGLAADATSYNASRKVFAAKSRPLTKPVSIAVDSLSMAYRFAKLSRSEEILFRRLLPGPLTIIVKPRPPISNILLSEEEKIGIRIPDNEVALKIIEKVGGPITATSANLSGHLSPKTADEALDDLEDKVKFVLDSGSCPSNRPSTIADVEGGIKIIREGPVSKSDILSVMERFKR